MDRVFAVNTSNPTSLTAKGLTVKNLSVKVEVTNSKEFEGCKGKERKRNRRTCVILSWNINNVAQSPVDWTMETMIIGWCQTGNCKTSIRELLYEFFVWV